MGYGAVTQPFVPHLVVGVRVPEQAGDLAGVSHEPQETIGLPRRITNPSRRTLKLFRSPIGESAESMLAANLIYGSMKSTNYHGENRSSNDFKFKVLKLEVRVSRFEARAPIVTASDLSHFLDLV